MTTPSERAPRTGARLLALWGLSLTVWWGFAFYPTAPGDTSWISLAQVACFGSPAGGAFEPQRWMMLVLAPLMLLGTLLALHGGELRRTLPALVRSRSAWTVAVVLVSVFALEVSWAAARIRQDSRAAAASFAPTIQEPLPADYPHGETPVPAFRLLDQHGTVCDASALRGEPTVLSFVFAHCTTVCPVLVANVSRAVRELGPGSVRVALVTLDPWRDTPTALPELTGRMALPEGSKFLSGDPAEVCRLLDTLNVARERDLKTGNVSHVPLVLIVDGDGRIAYRFNNPPVDWIVEGVRRVRTRT